MNIYFLEILNEVINSTYPFPRTPHPNIPNVSHQDVRFAAVDVTAGVLTAVIKQHP